MDRETYSTRGPNCESWKNNGGPAKKEEKKEEPRKPEERRPEPTPEPKDEPAGPTQEN